MTARNPSLVQPTIRQTTNTKTHGFTLVELLVAIVIFAILATLGWQVYDQLVRTKDKTEQKVEELSALQSSYRQLQIDLLNIVPIWQSTGKNQNPALVLSTKSLSFTRSRPKDPRYDKSASLERVTYQFIEDGLVRSTVRNLSDENEQPLSALLLSDISDVRFIALDPGEQPLWPALDKLARTPQHDGQPTQNQPQLTQLPRAIELSFTFNELPIVWRFELPKNTPKIQAPNEQDNTNNKGNNDNSDNQSKAKNDKENNTNEDDQDL